jgi:hypothetical protein
MSAESEKQAKRNDLLDGIAFARTPEAKAAAKKAYFAFVKSEVGDAYEERQHRRMIRG